MEPTKKSPAIDNLLKKMTGKDRGETIRSDTCMTCNDPDMNFRDQPSRKEYTISGLCQKCQDEVFGVEETLEDEHAHGMHHDTYVEDCKECNSETSLHA